MKEIYSPKDEAELVVLSSVLDGERIPHFIHNDHFGSQFVGPRIDLYNVKAIMVMDEDADRARELIEGRLKEGARSGGDAPRSSYSIRDRLRMIAEVLLLGWIMPGKRWRRRKITDSPV